MADRLCPRAGHPSTRSGDSPAPSLAIWSAASKSCGPRLRCLAGSVIREGARSQNPGARRRDRERAEERNGNAAYLPGEIASSRSLSVLLAPLLELLQLLELLELLLMRVRNLRFDQFAE